MSTPCATLPDVTLRKNFYVACNKCGSAAEEGIDGQAALAQARERGFRRVKQGGRMIDLCSPCYRKKMS